MIIEAAIEAGDDIPEFASEAPKLLDPLVFYYNAFWDLYRYRRVVARNDFVPWEVLERFAAKYGITTLSEFQEFSDLFRAMEEVYLESIPDQNETPQPEADEHGGFLGHS